MSFGELVALLTLVTDLGIFVLLVSWWWMDRNNIYFRDMD